MNGQLDVVRRYLATRGPAGRPTRHNVVVVGGGKGGAGASTVAALIAWGAAALGPTLLVDAGDDAGTLRMLLGLPELPGLEALRGAATGPLDLRAPLAPDLWFTGATAADAPLGGAEQRALYRRLAATYGEYALVVVDAGSTLQSIAAACDAGAARFLAVTAEDRISAAATFALVKVLAERQPELAVDIVVNRGSGPSTAYEAVRAAAARFLQRIVALAGTIPEDAALARAAHAGDGVAAMA
ncbi:MAG TPA: hypothetical protein VFQ38_21370, partial [Longimicrobiales bacterium]|nr:hypothetical protein [Longimicrobiales bacterium]